MIHLPTVQLLGCTTFVYTQITNIRASLTTARFKKINKYLIMT